MGGGKQGESVKISTWAFGFECNYSSVDQDADDMAPYSRQGSMQQNKLQRNETGWRRSIVTPALEGG